MGKGVALHIYMNAGSSKESLESASDAPLAGMSTNRYPVLASNDRATVDCTITLFWQNAKTTTGGTKHIPVTIQIHCWDSAGMRYETLYELMAFELSKAHQVKSDIAPGVMFTTRKVTHRSVRALKLEKRLKRLPLVGRLWKTQGVVDT